MSKTTARRMDREVRASRREYKAKDNTTTLTRSHGGDRISPQFFESRESLYQLVDLVDYLFDGMIG
jgi:hypothetical protein